MIHDPVSLMDSFKNDRPGERPILKFGARIFDLVSGSRVKISFSIAHSSFAITVHQ
jgi:hypothetical protein